MELIRINSNHVLVPSQSNLAMSDELLWRIAHSSEMNMSAAVQLHEDSV
jgi:hypothetical protein